jgi:hypothetical protein
MMKMKVLGVVTALALCGMASNASTITVGTTDAGNCSIGAVYLVLLLNMNKYTRHWHLLVPSGQRFGQVVRRVQNLADRRAPSPAYVVLLN